MLLRLVAIGLALTHLPIAIAQESKPVAIPSQGRSEPPPQPPRPVTEYAVRPANGAVSDPSPSTPKQAALEQKLREAQDLHDEIVQLKAELGTCDQIMIRMQMLEVSLTRLKKLQVDFSSINDGSKPFSVEQYDIEDIAGLRTAIEVGGATPYSHISGRPYQKRSVDGFIEFLVHNNIAKVLADPTLVVTTGHPASFHSGGEVPIVSSTDPAAEVTYRKTGTEMNVLAHSQENGRVRINIRGSVRELDDAHSISIGGARLPALTVRQFDTGVEGAIGQPIVLSGLVEKRTLASKLETGIREETNEVALIAVIVPELVGATAEAKPTIGDAKHQQIRLNDIVTVVFEQECGALQPNVPNRPESKSAKCTSRIAAQVVNVRANGDLEVAARREILADDSILHRQELSGVVHPESIDLESRTVSSSQIAELRVTTHSVSTPAADGKRR